ncbi:PDC sensor domain-containing protein [Pseudomonas mosselii]|uniref:PDC sensor domain-containing protein n=1 Tax=Pseudomonas mosselii TaxID=78327 RepID=UPI002448E5B1|nr:PDC sensor domain-containing protein [Pseudomonas mosselii]MDH1146251.1 PDC sensor domain-containing protein [Pseudomonas mosselii]
MTSSIVVLTPVGSATEIFCSAVNPLRVIPWSRALKHEKIVEVLVLQDCQGARDAWGHLPLLIAAISPKLNSIPPERQMPSQPKPRLNLRIVLLAFAMFSAVATLANTFWVMFNIQKQELVESALDGNRAYATRIADALEGVLSSDLDRLKYSSTVVSTTFSNRQLLAVEARRLLEQDNSFNSVLVTDAAGIIVASAPERLQLNGKSLQGRQPLERRSAMISNAFQSITGNLVVFVSHPVFDANGQYLGLVGGTIRLEQQNTLRALMDLNRR